MNLQKLTIDLLTTEEADGKLVGELVSLINKVYVVAEADFWKDGYLRTDENAIKKAIENSEVLVARQEGLIIACVYVVKIGGKVSKFGMLSVPPKYEGNGIGGLLVRAAESYARSNGANKMRLELLTPVDWTHPDKQQLNEWYTRLGYKFLHTSPFEQAVPSEADKLKISCNFEIYEKKLKG